MNGQWWSWWQRPEMIKRATYMFDNTHTHTQLVSKVATTSFGRKTEKKIMDDICIIFFFFSFKPKKIAKCTHEMTLTHQEIPFRIHLRQYFKFKCCAIRVCVRIKSVKIRLKLKLTNFCNIRNFDLSCTFSSFKQTNNGHTHTWKHKFED